jgi:hypothetical protein
VSSQWEWIQKPFCGAPNAQTSAPSQAHATYWVDGFKLKIPEFPRVLQPSIFWHWMLAVEEFFEFNGVPNERRVSLVVLIFQGVVATWWQHLKQRRRRQGKLKISSWEQLLKEMLDTFVHQKYTIGQQPQNWRQESTAVMKKLENFNKKRYFGKHGLMQRVHNRPIELILANHKSLHRTHILWMRKKNLWMESFRNPKSLMRSSNVYVLKMKILYKGL